MKKNVLVIVIDALSKWYIDQCKTENSFFGKLEKKTYCANNMFSTGPFTEAATRGLWASQTSLGGTSYLCESYFDNVPFYELFRNNDYYIYMGKFIPFFTDKIHIDNQNDRESCEVRGFDHIWRNRLQYFIDLNQHGRLSTDSIWKIEFLLDRYFESYTRAENVKNEFKKYSKDKRKYIREILEKEQKSSFFINQDSSLFFSCTYRNNKNLQHVLAYPLTNEESSFITKAKYKNLEYLVKMNQGSNFDIDVERALDGTDNRCIHSNNDLIAHLRNGYENLPKLCEEVQDFLSWYDKKEYGDKPFLAYIHNFDFHFPENFMNNRYEESEKYAKELEEKEIELSLLRCCNMSVSKQLSVLNIENCLETFWNELEKRNVFNDTYVILTADHGITNFMNPLNKVRERWNYKKTNFQVPFYIQGCEIEPYQDDNFHSAEDFLPSLVKKCNLTPNCNYIGKIINTEAREYLFTSWINGIPDLEYKPIRIGIRNKKYSITCEAFITQFIGSADILGIYNLENDENEVNSLNINEINNDKDFDNLFNILREEWFTLITSILLDNKSPYKFFAKYKFLDEKINLYRHYNTILNRISWDEFNRMVGNRKIILFGVSQGLYSFVSNPAFCYEIKEIWDNDINKSGRHILGNIVKQPSIESLDDNDLIVITSRYEIEIVEQLHNMGIEKFCIGALIR